MAEKKDFGISAEFMTDTHSDAFWRVSVREDGIVSSKVLTQEQFANTLAQGTIKRKEEKLFFLGKMPYGYVDAKIGGEGTYDVLVLYPKKRYGVRYYKDTYRVPYPNVLYKFTVKRGVVQSKYCFAIKDSDLKKGLSSKTPLYAFPFGNVSSGSGSMCFGIIKMPNMLKMAYVDNLVSLFLSGDVNDDLYSPSSNSTKNCKQFELFKFLENKKSFPDTLLCPVKAYSSAKQTKLGDVWNF